MSDAVEEFRRTEDIAWKRYQVTPSQRSLRLERLGLSVRVLEIGQGDPVLFVHGGGAIGSVWTPLWTGWSGARAIALDRPGCGLSDRFSYRGVDVRRHAVEVLEGVLDALGIAQAALVGNSMGGLWSFWLAIDRPRRVSRMVQIGCPALILDTSAPLPMRLMSIGWLGKLMSRMQPPTPENMRKLFALLGHRDTALPDELLIAAAAGSRLPVHDEGWLSLLGNVLSLGGKRVTLGEDDLKRVEQPVHFIWGASDPFGGVDVGRKACGILPHASLEVLGTGHVPWLDAPEACRKAVQAFLQPQALAA
jgi:pimeloyl-ACP methyl ester carboxylesterase